MIPNGWAVRPATGFNELVGPYYEVDGAPAAEKFVQCGFRGEARHGNARGVVHGGMLATALDTALAQRCAAEAGMPCAGIQLNVQYVGGMQSNDFAAIPPEVVRATRRLLFVPGVMRVDDRTIATADGIWTILAPRTEAKPAAG